MDFHPGTEKLPHFRKVVEILVEPMTPKSLVTAAVHTKATRPNVHQGCDQWRT